MVQPIHDHDLSETWDEGELLSEAFILVSEANAGGSGPPEEAPMKPSKRHDGNVYLQREHPPSLYYDNEDTARNSSEDDYENGNSNSRRDNAASPDILLDMTPLFQDEDMENAARQEHHEKRRRVSMWTCFLASLAIVTCLVIVCVAIPLLVIATRDKDQVSPRPTTTASPTDGTMINTTTTSFPTMKPTTLAPTPSPSMSLTEPTIFSPTTTPPTVVVSPSPTDPPTTETSISTNPPTAIRTPPTTTTTPTLTPTLPPQQQNTDTGRLTTLPPFAITSLNLTLPNFTLNAIQTNPESPQAKAYTWLEGHPLMGDFDEWRKQQVYALATIYYSFQDSASSSTRTFFRREYLNYFVSECFWGGVGSACNEDERIQELRISECTNPNATVPPEIVLLPSLRSISIVGCTFYNATLETVLPPLEILTQLQDLTRIHLLWNPGLGGTLPDFLFSLSQLMDLYLESNDLEGIIPTSIGLLSNLERLGLVDNPQLIGPLPDEIGLFTQLTGLSLQDNSLNGTIPDEIAELSQLEVVEIYGNSFLGTLPAILCKFANLRLLEIDCDYILCPLGCECECHE